MSRFAKLLNVIPILILLLLPLSFVHGQNSEANLETLKLVQLIFRHGERTPEYPYPNDPFSDASVWPQGWGQLTDEGKRQEHRLGQYLRQRYGNYLNSTYVPNQLYTVSSETDRTIMSALLMLAGMFPTNNESNWDNSINWQPVPIRVVFTEQDNYIRFKRKCPKFDELFNDFINNSPMMKKINEENKELFATLSRNSGVNITNINDIDAFYASLYVEENLGLDIPEWGKPLKTDQHFQYLYNLSFQAKTWNDDLKRLRTGPLVEFLISNFQERVNNASSTRKMVALSAHDITLIDILNTFGVHDLHRPTYSSVFMMELHEEPANGGKFFVEFYLRNDTTREPYKLTLPGCEFHCPLETVLANTKNIIPENWENECKLIEPAPPAETQEGTSTFTYVLIGVGVVALSVFLVGLAFMALKKKKRNIIDGNNGNQYRTF